MRMTRILSNYQLLMYHQILIATNIFKRNVWTRAHSVYKGGKFLKKLWCCVSGEYYKMIWFYQQILSDETNSRSPTTDFQISLRWPIHIFINSVDKTKLSCYIQCRLCRRSSARPKKCLRHTGLQLKFLVYISVNIIFAGTSL